MATKIYPVFRIDKCFEEYASDEDLIGGLSVEDILNHFDEIYPPSEIKVIHEDWMDVYEWEEESCHGKYKDGDTKIEPYFNELQMEAFKKSLDEDNRWPRIKQVPHLYTDTPYQYLTGFGYME